MLAIGALAASAAHADEIGEAPQPWFKNGMKPAVEQCSGGADTTLGTPNLTLKCDATVDGFVGVMQRLDAEQYKNHRVRFSALVKTEGIEGWGGLWMRIDDVDRPGAAFDNMQSRPLKGTTEWTPYSVVLDVSSNAQGVYFGTLMSGKGQLWVTDWRLESVGTEVATTGVNSQGGPANLSLSR
jgi:hypothetical protein